MQGAPNGLAAGPDGTFLLCNNGGFAWHEEPGLLRPAGQSADYAGGRIEVIGAAGSASLVGGALDLAWADGRRERVEAEGSTGSGANIMDFPHDAHRALIADFLDACREGRAPAVSGEEALESQRWVERILARAAEKAGAERG